ncbi:MAG: hypothetical protein HYY76_19360 [Acidobacteria bacterium]|nr:hypothetical protein [Acidobacteriota bacterium]
MSTAAALFAAGLAIAMSGIVSATAGPAPSVPGDPDIVQRFLASNGPSLTEYQAVRRLEARNERFNAGGWLEVCTDLLPDRGFHYRVLAEGGSHLIRGRVLKKALEGERQAWATGEVDRSRLEPANYEFQETDVTDGELRKVTLTPRRKSRMLVDGAMFLRPDDGDLVRVEGTLAGSPSFWTRRVEVTRRYERIAGVRVPVALESVAHVRMVGRSSFRMSYRYLSVNGRTLDVSSEPCAMDIAGVQSSRMPRVAPARVR